MKSDRVAVDAVIIGGGIAGLWTSARLSAEGYSCVLLETHALGAGQTIGSQGILHGGIKFALTGTTSRASRAVAGMPGVWRACLEGRGELDLRGVRVLSDSQCLWTTPDLLAHVAGFFASKAMRTQGRALDLEQHEAFRGAGRGIRLYQVPEQVIDPRSLVAVLAERSGGTLVKPDEVIVSGDGSVTAAGRGRRVRLEARRVILAAGAGNEGLLRQCGFNDGPGTPQVPMQRRPLHMVMVRGSHLPTLYGHCVTTASKPRLTVTTQEDAAGRIVWYIGGLLAENGIDRDARELVRTARSELVACLPWLDWSEPSLRWASCRWVRAEGLTPEGARPDEPVIRAEGKIITLWPTKLVFAPRVAADVLSLLRRQGVHPVEPLKRDALAGLERPAVAPLPWEQEDLSWMEDRSVLPGSRSA